MIFSNSAFNKSTSGSFGAIFSHLNEDYRTKWWPKILISIRTHKLTITDAFIGILLHPEIFRRRINVVNNIQLQRIYKAREPYWMYICCL